LIGAIDGSTGLTGTGAQYDSASTPLDAVLAELGDYGGTTRTHRLLSTSPAIDAGDNSVIGGYGEDQRGLPRIVDWEADDEDDIVDIGAVELAFEENYS
jgi:hypothetical protein